jgi:quercetin 2,3-dioxygenase
MAKTIFHAADQRGHANHGWLDTYHSFSFAGWYDPSKIHFGMLRVLNDDTVAGGSGFGKHPHDNMEIITIVLEGKLEHRDTMGHTQTISPGEVQVMSAGTGLQHSEYNHEKNIAVKLFQIWIFPETRNIAPRYDQAMFDPEGRKGSLQQVVSPSGSDEPGLKIHQQARIYRTELTAGSKLDYNMVRPGNGVYVMAVEGSATVGGQRLQRRDAVGIYDTDTVALVADSDCELLVLEVPMA